MTPISYLLSVTTSQKDVEVTLAILNIAGRGQAFYGFSNGSVSTDLWIVPKGKGDRQEVITRLQATPAVHSVSIVALNNPVNEKELAEVRELFAFVGWDTSDVTDEALSLFINARLRGEYTYYIDYDRREKEPVKIQIKPIEDHPNFSPDWLKTIDAPKEEIPDRELTIDDLEITSIELETIEEDEPPPPPPPNSKQ